MDNNQNVNMNSQSVNPANQVPNTDTNAQNNVVTLGTVSNVTYADTIGEIDYSDVVTNENEKPPVNTSNDTNKEGFINSDYNETSISDLNVEGAYNNMNVRPDYTSDPKVMEIIHPDPAKKNTVKIGKELKTFFIIAAILLAFIMVLPNLFDLLNNIRFRH